MSVKAKQIAITSPCPITLDRTGIQAQDKTMFCAHCTKDVHLLSQMTESEARQLMQDEAGQDICVSYAIRTDGSIRFRPDPNLIPATTLIRRQTPAPRRRMSLVATVGASLLLAACTPHNPEGELLVGQIEAKPLNESEQPELVEQIPCDSPDTLPPLGGIRAMPLPEPDPEMLVDGGIRAEPLPEPEPEQPEPDTTIEPAKDSWKGHRRGGIRVRPIDPEVPLGQL